MYIKVIKVQFALVHVEDLKSKEDFEKRFPHLNADVYWKALKEELRKAKK